MDAAPVEELISLANQHYVQRRISEAADICQRILSRDPNRHEALHLLGVLRLQAGQVDEAQKLVEKAIGCKPDAAEYHNSLGNIFVRRGLLPDAITAFSRAKDIRPNYTTALSNLGATFKKTGQYDPAIDAFRRAIAASPDFAQAHWNYGLLLLQQGDFEHGWREYEYRIELPELGLGTRRFAEPRWDGQKLDGKAILLHAEQGFGDAIQFSRYIPRVAEMGGRIILEVPAGLHRLFRDSFELVDTLISREEQHPAFDVHCPLMSLSLAFKTNLATIPRDVPYIVAAQERLSAWKQRLISGTRLKIGLAWAGNPKHLNDRNRSMPLSVLATVGDGFDVDFYSLQKGDASGEILSSKTKLVDWTRDLNDFAETAALIRNLDLVITIDSVVAHLAGALAVPVWLLLPTRSDWRWLLGRNDSPWYPTMRLFRQKQPGVWDDPIHEIRESLATMIQTKR
jgi:Flp pilus assembly protein TadD